MLFGLEAKLITGAILLAALFGWHELQVHNAASGARKACQDSYQAAALKATDEARTEETRRITAQTEIADEALRMVNRNRRDSAAAATAHGRLLERIAAGSRQAASNPATTDGSASASGAGILLADVLRKSDERSGLLATLADDRGTAGAACEKAYDALNH